VTAPADSPPSSPPAARTPWLHTLHPVYRLILRWAYISVLTVVAFHASIHKSWETLVGGGLGGYAWIVPVAAILAAQGIARRNRTELPIHDRQTDVIVGIMGMVFALLLHGVLLQRYALYFYLLRLDLAAMWTFVISASVALFGLRPVIRFGWAWVVLAMVFPLPYYLSVILLGGNRLAAGVVTMFIAAFATATAVGRHVTRAVVGSTLAWIVGLSILGGLAIFAPEAPLWVYQFVPALTAMCLVGSAMFLGARRGASKRALDRKIEPLAAGQVWSAVPVVLVIAIALSFVRLPDTGLVPPTRVDAMDYNASLAPPPGWHVVDTQVFTWVSRLYGRGSTLVRQKMVADKGDPQYDKSGRPRTIMVDTINTRRPFSLNTYPARMLYRIDGIRLSTVRSVDLGYGTQGDLLSVVDDRILVTWDGLQWTWTNGTVARRVLAIAVDNHEDNAPFPDPTGGVGPTLNSMFTVLFRGNASATFSDPNIKDYQLLTEFGHGLVRAELEPLGIRP
jgi:hypothetical protein